MSEARSTLVPIIHDTRHAAANLSLANFITTITGNVATTGGGGAIVIGILADLGNNLEFPGTEPVLTVGVGPMKVAHIAELRTAVMTLE